MTVNANLFARLQASFEKHANRVAIETPAGQIYDYADLEREAGRYAGFLRAQGVQQGDRVAVQVEKSPESLNKITSTRTCTSAVRNSASLMATLRALNSPPIGIPRLILDAPITPT